ALVHHWPGPPVVDYRRTARVAQRPDIVVLERAQGDDLQFVFGHLCPACYLIGSRLPRVTACSPGNAVNSARRSRPCQATTRCSSAVLAATSCPDRASRA